MKTLIASLVADALERAHVAGKLAQAAAFAPVVERPADPAHGDAATNIALMLARAEGKSPAALASVIVQHIVPTEQVERVWVAGPGFINFRMAPGFWHEEMRRALAAGQAYFQPSVGGGRKVQVEFLSANPTGPLTVGHGRNAVVGDTLARLFEATGHNVMREYYFNNGGRQMKLLGASVRARYLQELGHQAELPEDGYQGEYIREIARALVGSHGDALASGSADASVFREAAESAIFAEIKRTCQRLGVRFDRYVNESDLLAGGQVAEVLEGLRERQLVVERDGALWLKGDTVGLGRDVVLVRSGPAFEPTYRTPDIAYHIQKLRAGYDLILDVLGADHIAQHQEVLAALRGLGWNPAPIKAVIYQFVTLTSKGQKLKMSTRRATYVTLDELLDEVGTDVARFFFLSRKSDTHLDFDLDLAKRQAPENPVFYVQYAHARLASIFREAEKAQLAPLREPGSADFGLLSEEELQILKVALALPEVVAQAVETLEPHRIPFYLVDLAGQFHRYYNKPTNRIVGPDPALSGMRLVVAKLLKEAIRVGLELLGVTAPERM
ncbi:MAG: arginine--tRNA ligase [Deltaproteobacteria bacterium]|nr:arginine--tRNA ligase [Deltaproteobacteria bacterium]